MGGKNLIVVVGPTGVGKSDFCIGLAQRLGTDIISADSRQIYKGMEIGTAAPTPEQKAAVRHHFVGCLAPTEYYSDIQWWELVNRQQVMQFTEFPPEFQPIVQSIDTWFLSRKIGMLFEARVGAGRLLMTTMDLRTDLQRRVVARQMLASILAYMESDDFRPRDEVDAARVAELFTKETPRVDSYTKNSPDELRPVPQKGGR